MNDLTLTNLYTILGAGIIVADPPSLSLSATQKRPVLSRTGRLLFQVFYFVSRFARVVLKGLFVFFFNLNTFPPKDPSRIIYGG